MDEETEGLNTKFKDRVNKRQEILQKNKKNKKETESTKSSDGEDDFVKETEKTIPTELSDLDSIFKTIYSNVPMDVKDIKYRNILKENMYIYAIMTVIGFSMWMVSLLYSLY